jgi:predicted dehydrogenase
VTDVLVEKPAGLGLSELLRVREAAAAAGSQVFVAYNRRFYSSVRKAREIIETDENAGTVVFDFTERGYLIAAADKSKEVLQNWFLANSTHVIDLAFHLAGEPANLEARVAGGLSWHPEGSRFVGIGTTAKNALFAYHADWEGPGGWSVEITTRKHRLILRPLEILKVQRLGSMTVEVSKLDDVLDRRFKPGVYRQMESFLGAQEGLLTLHQQIERVEGPLATMISGGKWPG